MMPVDIFSMHFRWEILLLLEHFEVTHSFLCGQNRLQCYNFRGCTLVQFRCYYKCYKLEMSILRDGHSAISELHWNAANEAEPASEQNRQDQKS